MGKITFELTNDHINLIKNLDFKSNSNVLVCDFNITGDKYQDIEIILKGRISDADLTTTSYEYNDEIKEYYDKLIEELPIALNIIIQNLTVNSGVYSRLSYQNNWNLIK